MLKIKDNVELDFLKQLGFVYEPETEQYYKEICEDRRGSGVTMIIGIYHRLIELCFYGDDNGYAGYDYLDDTIYYMFNANIIEKVNNEKEYI